MSDAVLLLCLEHEDAAKLLGLLDEQLRGLEAGNPLDYELLKSAVDYLSGYPDQCHHPKEDLVFRKLATRDPAAAAGLSNLIEEHKELARLTERFAQLVSEKLEKSNTPIEPLKSIMRQFVDFYYHHMSMEEKHFFPTALRSLSRNDWAEIDFALFDRDDPLFDEAEERFATLRREISRLAEKQNDRKATQTLLKEEAKHLHGLTSIAQFNEMMQNSGTDFRLIRLPEANYGLEVGERFVIGIPECSEARAVWCAYYFLKGQDVRVGL